jgi:hypothetical protein
MRGMHIGIWWGKTEGKRPLGGPRSKWEDNIEIENRVGWHGLYSSGSE